MRLSAGWLRRAHKAYLNDDEHAVMPKCFSSREQWINAQIELGRRELSKDDPRAEERMVLCEHSAKGRRYALLSFA